MRVNVCDTYTLELLGLPCPPPTLQITPTAAPGQALLQWSSASPDFHLQVTDAVRPGINGFSNVTASPVLVGGKFTVTNSLTPAVRFFRLAK